MLSENLKTLRKTKGLSQEELAIRLCVVRQTVSKWEKGLSVPDAELLVKLAEIFEVPVSRLLGMPIESSDSSDAVAEQLSRINEQLAVKNRRAHRIWRVAAGILLAVILWNILLIALSFASFRSFQSNPQVTVDGNSQQVDVP